MTTLGPLDHIARQPLPWRATSDYTECGKPVTEVAGRVVTRDTIAKRIRDIGKQRAAYTTCMTCASTSDRWTSADPDQTTIRAIRRETSAIGDARPPLSDDQYARMYRVNPQHDHEQWARRQRFVAELRAIGALIEAHRDEFDGYLTDLSATVSLAEHRSARRAR